MPSEKVDTERLRAVHNVDSAHLRLCDGLDATRQELEQAERDIRNDHLKMMAKLAAAEAELARVLDIQGEMMNELAKLTAAHNELERLRALIREFRQKCDPDEEHVLVTPDELAMTEQRTMGSTVVTVQMDSDVARLQAQLDRYQEALEHWALAQKAGFRVPEPGCRLCEPFLQALQEQIGE